MTIQNAPPGLDYDRDKRFSKVLISFLNAISHHSDKPGINVFNVTWSGSF